ncbi:hypothetical protein AB0873_16375 [Micromonospora sp. NPDC047707]|uniref:hypothetical protein n=1 Tax=Micromonospora sp. NPDC047707 TaxID=3154498 RepID=UPI0034541F7D
MPETAAGLRAAHGAAHDEHGQPVPVRLATDNGPAFTSAALARFIAARPELTHICAARRHQTPTAYANKRSGH